MKGESFCKSRFISSVHFKLTSLWVLKGCLHWYTVIALSSSFMPCCTLPTSHYSSSHALAKLWLTCCIILLFSFLSHCLSVSLPSQPRFPFSFFSLSRFLSIHHLLACTVSLGFQSEFTRCAFTPLLDINNTLLILSAARTTVLALFFCLLEISKTGNFVVSHLLLLLCMFSFSHLGVHVCLYTCVCLPALPLHRYCALLWGITAWDTTMLVYKSMLSLHMDIHQSC